MTRDFTKITTNLLLGVKDLAEWGIEGGHTTAEKLRLTVSARQEQAKKLIGGGMSERKAAKLLGVTQTQIRRDVKRKVSKSETKGFNKQRFAGPVDRCAMTLRSTVLEIMSEMTADEWEQLFAALRDELDDLEKIAARRKSDGHHTARKSA